MGFPNDVYESFDRDAIEWKRYKHRRFDACGRPLWDSFGWRIGARVGLVNETDCAQRCVTFVFFVFTTCFPNNICEGFDRGAIERKRRTNRHFDECARPLWDYLASGIGAGTWFGEIELITRNVASYLFPFIQDVGSQQFLRGLQSGRS